MDEGERGEQREYGAEQQAVVAGAPQAGVAIELDQLRGRVRRLEAAMAVLEAREADAATVAARLAEEVSTRRLAVVDRSGTERLVAETVDGVAEVRLQTAPGGASGTRAELLLFAAPGGAGLDLPPGVGLQLWARGEAEVELSWWGDRP